MGSLEHQRWMVMDLTSGVLYGMGNEISKHIA
jgi:hypothetical protein